MTHNATRDDDPTNITPTDADDAPSPDAHVGDPDHWTLADRDLTSRLFLGTGGMTSLDIMEKRWWRRKAMWQRSRCVGTKQEKPTFSGCFAGTMSTSCPTRPAAKRRETPC